MDPLHGAQGPEADPRGSLWFTLFDAAAEGPRAAKVTHPDPRARGADHIEIGGSSFGPAGARGEALDASWDLTHVGGEPPLLHLPRDWMYRAPIPRTKTLSPHPAALFRGSLTVGGRTLELEGWPGMVGHNWGAEHAERWIWLHGIGFGAVAEGSWIDVALGRIRLGPLTTPWIANGAICLGGIRHRLGGVERTLDAGPRVAHPLRVRAARRRHLRPGQRVLRGQELRRLGLRGPRRLRAQRAQLLDRRHAPSRDSSP